MFLTLNPIKLKAPFIYVNKEENSSKSLVVLRRGHCIQIGTSNNMRTYAIVHHTQLLLFQTTAFLETDFIRGHSRNWRRNDTKANLFRIQKRFPVSSAVACSDPTETLKFDSRGSAKIDLQGARRRTLMYKISAGYAEGMSWLLERHERNERPRTRRHADPL